MNENVIKTIDDIVRHSSNKDLISIALVGSYARGTQDKYSDIDFVCVYEDNPSPIFVEGKNKINGFQCGVRNIPLKYLEKRDWSQIEKHAYTYSKIIYEKNNQFNQLIKEKCVWRNNELKGLFSDTLVKLSYTLDMTDNYKNSFNDYEELENSELRGCKFFSSQLKINVLKYALTLGLLRDEMFIPPDKVLLSDWVENNSPNAKKIYRKAKKVQDNFLNLGLEELRSLFSKEIYDIVLSFDEKHKLDDNIYNFRISYVRDYSIN